MLLADYEGLTDDIPAAPSLDCMAARVRLEGAKALVTGAGAGIGRATAQALAARGATVVVTDIDVASAEKVAAEINEHGGRSSGLQLDVTDSAAIVRMAADQLDVDILVCNAGVGMTGAFGAMTMDDWRWIRSINLDGVVECTHAFGPAMVARRSGQVVIIASGLGYTPRATEPAYVTTKAAVLAFAQCLPRRLAFVRRRRLRHLPRRDEHEHPRRRSIRRRRREARAAGSEGVQAGSCTGVGRQGGGERHQRRSRRRAGEHRVPSRLGPPSPGSSVGAAVRRSAGHLMPRKRSILLAALGVAGAAGAIALARSRREHDDAPLATLTDGDRSKVETSDGAVLDVHIAGDGPTVVLADCWGGSMETWGPVAAALVERGYRVVRYDQRGHGGSTIGADGLGIERLGTDMREVLEAVDVRDAVVAGHSTGGFATQAFVIAYPEIAAERVKAIVLASTASGGLGRVGLEPIASRVIGNPLVHQMLVGRAGVRFVRGAFGKRASRAATMALRDTFTAVPPETHADLLRAIFAMDLREGRRSITLPTTVVVGALDTLTPPMFSREIADDIPGARLVQIPGAGHMLPYEATEELTDLIDEAARQLAA